MIDETSVTEFTEVEAAATESITASSAIIQTSSIRVTLKSSSVIESSFEIPKFSDETKSTIDIYSISDSFVDIGTAEIDIFKTDSKTGTAK